MRRSRSNRSHEALPLPFALLATTGILTSLAFTACDKPATPTLQWTDANRITVASKKRGIQGTLIYERTPEDDIRVDLDEGKWEMLLIGMRVLLMRPGSAEPFPEFSWEGSVLTVQLAMSLLQRAFPKGPMAVQTSQRFAVTESTDHIQLSTPGLQMGFRAPWSLSGLARRKGPWDRCNLRLEHSGNRRNAKGELEMTIMWHKDPDPPRIKDETSLQTWEVQGLPEGAQSAFSEDGPDSTPPPVKLHTIGDIRRFLAAHPIQPPKRRKN